MSYPTQYIYFLQQLMKVTSQRKPVETQNKKISKPPTQWESLVNSLVRPPRMRYSQTQLGYKQFSLKQQKFSRTDQVVNHDDKKIYLSIFNPSCINYKIILYLHGNSSSRLQSKNLLLYLPPQYSLASFDFIGCGNNMEDDVITLGFDESKQVQSVTNYLKAKNYRVFLWGRSMGAASALLYGKVDVIVADSPFRSVKKLCQQLSTSKVNPLPTALVKCLFPCVFLKLRSDVRKKGKYDLQDINIQKAVKKINPSTTIIFISAIQDELVNPSNSQKLFNMFPGKNKFLQFVQGDHNSKRPDQVMYKIMRYVDIYSQKLQPTQNNTRQSVEMQTNIANLDKCPQTIQSTENQMQYEIQIQE